MVRAIGVSINRRTPKGGINESMYVDTNGTVDEEYHVQVGNNDYYVDLLFYHRELQCLVAIDLKIDDFKPEYLGKMDFYLEALDRDVRKPHENPSVGMILCKNAVIATYRMGEKDEIINLRGWSNRLFICGIIRQCRI